MNSFKDIAYQILKEVRKPLHSKEITKIALSRGWLKTAGKTPEATMKAQLIVDINTKKEKSRFVKTGPSVFGLNENFIAPEIKEIKKELEKIYKERRSWSGVKGPFDRDLVSRRELILFKQYTLYNLQGAKRENDKKKEAFNHEIYRVINESLKSL